MNISIIGTGYVGLVTGTCFAETGNHVICMDVDTEKISQLKKGISPIYEPGLQELLTRNIKGGRLKFSSAMSEAVKHAEIIFLALPTPPQEDGSADLQYMIKVSQEISGLLREATTIVLKSTVPVGTNETIRNIFAARSKVPATIVSNPEFQKQGAAVRDFMSPDRVVVGTSDPGAAELMRELYAPFMRTSDRFILMDEKSAELTKYAANSFLAMKISFMNEIARLCDTTGADVEMVRRGISADPRIGQQFLFPGVGYGGSCFPKDVKALRQIGENAGVTMRIVTAVDDVNKSQSRVLVNKVMGHFGGSLKGRTFGVWGLSFKPKTDDMREAPATAIIENLLQAGAEITAFDPVAIESAKKIFGKKVSYAKEQYAALKGIDALILVTEWQEFREPDFGRMKDLMKGHVIFDGRNIYNPDKVRARGFQYYGIGRK